MSVTVLLLYCADVPLSNYSLTHLQIKVQHSGWVNESDEFMQGDTHGVRHPD